MDFRNIYKNVLVLLAASVILCSCEDYLTHDHPTEVTDEDFWTTANECQSALDQCYDWPSGCLTWTAPNLSWTIVECASDNGYWYREFHTDVNHLGSGSLTAAETFTLGSTDTMWGAYYNRIRRINRLIDHIGTAYFTEESDRTRMIADARAWRAWYHMQLLMFYGPHDGVPIVDKVMEGAEISEGHPRNTVEEVLTFCNNEFDELLAIDDDNVMPFLWDKQRRTRMCKAYILTLKMDMNLYFHNYDIAKEAAQEIIDSGVFSLYYTTSTDDDPGKNYRDLFRYVGEDNNERIMYRENGLNEIWARTAPTALNGEGTSCILKSLVDEYELADGRTLSELSEEERTKVEHEPLSVDRDPRLYATVVVPLDSTSVEGFVYDPFCQLDPASATDFSKQGNSKTGYWLKKFNAPEDRNHPWSGTLDFPLYRYAEVLLDYVECCVETGDWQNPKVEEYINMIRNRAGMPDMDKTKYNTQEKVRELYRRERRVELAYEGKRYFDIRRWGIGPETMTGPAEGAWNPNANQYVVVEQRNCTFPKFDSWPIPQTEEIVNESIDQPTGW